MAKKRLIESGIHLTQEQKEVKGEVMANRVIFLEGRAGTSKTFLSIQIALDLFHKKEVDKIVITRPPIEAGASLGYLPGGFDSKDGKLAPYLIPVFEIFEEIIGMGGKQVVDQMVANGEIVVTPPQLIRGWNFKRAIVIIDEAQNLTVPQLKLILSRLCKGSKLIFTMDERQIDLVPTSTSCYKVLKKLNNASGVFFGRLTENHRDPLAIELLDLIEE